MTAVYRVFAYPPETNHRLGVHGIQWQLLIMAHYPDRDGRFAPPSGMVFDEQALSCLDPNSSY